MTNIPNENQIKFGIEYLVVISLEFSFKLSIVSLGFLDALNHLDDTHFSYAFVSNLHFFSVRGRPFNAIKSSDLSEK